MQDYVCVHIIRDRSLYGAYDVHGMRGFESTTSDCSVFVWHAL